MAGDLLHKDPARPLRVALVYPRLWRQVRSFLPPLGLVSLATVARAAGHEVRIFDPSFDRTPRRIKGQLRRFDPEVVGLSVSSDLYPLAQELCAFARRLGARTVMGGPHATICAEEVLAQTRDLDVVLAGEGENTLPALLAAWASGDDPAGLPGVISRRGEEVTAGPPAEWTQAPVWQGEAAAHQPDLQRQRLHRADPHPGVPVPVRLLPAGPQASGRRLPQEERRRGGRRD